MRYRRKDRPAHMQERPCPPSMSLNRRARTLTSQKGKGLPRAGKNLPQAPVAVADQTLEIRTRWQIQSLSPTAITHLATRNLKKKSRSDGREGPGNRGYRSTSTVKERSLRTDSCTDTLSRGKDTPPANKIPRSW